MSLDEFFDNYTPVSVDSQLWVRFKPQVKDLMIQTCHGKEHPDQLRQLARLLTMVLAQAEIHGLTGVEEVFHHEVIEHLVASQDWSSRVQSQSRSALVRVAKMVNPYYVGVKDTNRYPYISTTTPYSPHDICELVDWSENLSTQHQRTTSGVVLALGLGAGLRVTEMATLTVKDVEVDSQGVVVFPGGYRGAKKRFTPVSARFAHYVVQGIEGLKDDDYVFLPSRTNASATKVADFLKRLVVPSTSALPTTTRMRATWIVDLMHRGIPESAICDAAGLTDLQHYAHYRAQIETPTARSHRMLIAGTSVPTGSSRPRLTVVSDLPSRA